MKNDRGKNSILSSNIFANSNINKQKDSIPMANITSNSQNKKIANATNVSDPNSFRFKEVSFKFKTGKNSRNINIYLINLLTILI